jgi:hypothetical protein
MGTQLQTNTLNSQRSDSVKRDGQITFIQIKSPFVGQIPLLIQHTVNVRRAIARPIEESGVTLFSFDMEGSAENWQQVE